MKDKEKLSMYVDITRITIILCWIALIAFWCLKLFGGNWFEIMVENENFIKFSDLVQNTWLKYVISFITIFTSNYLLFCSICQKFYLKGKDALIVLCLILSMWIVVNFIHIDAIKMWYGYILLILYSFLYHKGKKRLLGVIAALLDCAFSIISALVRNIEINVVQNYLIIFILTLDMYIMYILYYLYSNLKNLLKGENEMALLLGHGILSKEDAQKRGYSNFKRFCHNARYIASFKWAKKK